jgi:nucleoside transporter
MSTVAVESTPSSVRYRLAVMMFLQYFVQGSYLTVVSDYLQTGLKFNGDQIGWFMAALSVGPMFAPFIVGQLVDRLLPTERVLAACHFLAGLLMFGLYYQTEFWPVFALGTVYSILYIPTMMLTNSLAFHHLSDRDREFPLIRLWGTIGFIVPAWLIRFYFLKGLTGDELNRAQGVMFAVSGIGGLVMACYALTLPSTPPNPRGSGKFAPGVVLSLFGRRDFGVLFVATFFLAAAHNYFFVFNPSLVKAVLVRNAAADWSQVFTTIGQVAEIGVMTLLGPSIVRIGYKRTMLIGGTAYALRCVVLAAAGSTSSFTVAVSLAAIGQALHGVCFGFFLAAAFVYVDRKSPADVKGSMQTIYGTLIFGLGAVAGGLWGGKMVSWYSTGTGESAVYQWEPIWLACAAVAGLCTLAMAAAFPRTPPEPRKVHSN